MKKDEKLWEICKEIYQELYKEATPPLDFNKELAAGTLNRPGWFMEHYLAQERQNEIMNEIMTRYKLDNIERRKVVDTINLGASPAGWRGGKK